MTTSAVALGSTFRVAQNREVSAGRVATGWAVLMLATELKVSLAYVHWIVSALALGVLWPYLVETRCAHKFPAQVPARLFVAAVCLPAIYGLGALYSLAEAGKLAVILLGATAIFVSRSRLALHAFRGFIIAVGMNFILLMGGYLGLGTAEEMAANRWGTLISWPGSLSRVAGSVWVYAAYLVVKRRSPSALVLLAASTFLVYVDGSRTVLLLLLLGAVFVVIVLAAEAGRLRRSLLRFLVIATIGFGALLMVIQYSGVLSGETTVEDQGAIGRFRLLINTFEAAGVENLGSADVVRYQMLQDVLEAIRAHPIHLNEYRAHDQLDRENEMKSLLAPHERSFHVCERPTYDAHPAAGMQVGMGLGFEARVHGKREGLYFAVFERHRVALKRNKRDHSWRLQDLQAFSQVKVDEDVSWKEHHVELFAAVFPAAHAAVHREEMSDFAELEICGDRFFVARTNTDGIPARIADGFIAAQSGPNELVQRSLVRDFICDGQSHCKAKVCPG